VKVANAIGFAIKVGAFRRNIKMSFLEKPKKAPQLECFFKTCTDMFLA
jgi:hypothetical protein